MQKIQSFSFVLVLMILLATACQKQTAQRDLSSEKITTASYTEIAETTNGKLEITGFGEDQMHVLCV